MNSPDRQIPSTPILAIDNDRDRELKTFLGGWGYRICHAVTGREGLEKAVCESPHLILLEIEMPDLDGYEICRRLKENPDTREIPVIFIGCRDVENHVSGDGEREILKSFEIGGADYISKPLEMCEVLARIKHQLTRQERQSQLQQQNQQLQEANRELRQTKAALEAGQAKFRGILEIAEEAIISIDENHTIQLFNQGAEKIFGYPRDEIIGQPLTLLLPEESREIHQNYIRDFGKSEKISRQMSDRAGEVRGRRKNGDEFPAEASISQLKLASGWLFTVILKDISDRQQAEAELRAAKNDLEARVSEQTTQILATNDRLRQEIRERRNSEIKFRQLAENIRDVFYIHEFDANFKSLYISPAFEQIWGIPREELHRNPYAWMESIHPDDRPRVASPIPKPEDFLDFDCEFRILRPDGEIRWIRDRAFPVYNEDNQIYRLAGIAEDITERKQAETRLRNLNQHLETLIAQRTAQLQSVNAELSAQKQQLEAIAANIPNGAVYRAIFRPDGFFSLAYISEGIEKLAGLDRESIQRNPQSLLEIFPPEALAHFEQHLQVALETLQPSRFDFCMAGDGRQKKWLQNNSSFYRLENGEIVSDGLILDISDRVAAETALRESEERFRIIFEQTPTGINLTDPSGRFLSVNPKCCELFGYPRAELLERRFHDITYPDDLAEDVRLQNRLAAGQISNYSLEKRFLRQDGTVWWGRLTLSAIRSDRGTLKHFVAVVENIQERKEWQAALEHQIQRQLLLGEITAEIRQSLDSERIFQTTVGKIGEAFSVDRCALHRYLPSSTRCVPLVAEYLSPETRSMAGWDIPAHNNPHLEQLLQQEKAIATDEIASDPLFAPALLIYTQLEIQSLLSIATFYNGEPNGVICLHQCRDKRHWTREEIELIEAIAAQVGIALAQADLLEREKQRQEELAYKNVALKQATRAAEAASLAKSEFLANMSHEIRTPMNAILGFCELLQERVTEGRSRSYLESIKASGKTLLTLIDDLLDLSKIEAGKLQLHYEPINLYALIEEIQIFFSEQIYQKGLQWVVEINPNVPPFPIFDEVRLRQILFNVVGNALKFTECGHIKITVTSLIGHPSPVTRHPLSVTRHPSPVISHPSPVISYQSPVISYQRTGNEEQETEGAGKAGGSGRAEEEEKTEIHPSSFILNPSEEIYPSSFILNPSEEIHPSSFVLHPFTYTLEIAIEDTGIGIAPEQQEIIFEAFKQNEGQSTRKYGGTGLGLAITKRLTEMLGGHVKLQSVLARGSTFTFVFPNLQCATDASPSYSEWAGDDRFQHFPPLTILVADDILSHRNLIAGYFAESDHHLLLAEDGRQTLDIARTHPLDLILLDLRMPNLNGWEVARTLKTNPDTRGIPLLILTASTLRDDEEELRSLCDGFLRKPFDRAQLAATMKKVLPLRDAIETTPDSPVAIEPRPFISGESPQNLPELLEKLQQYEQTTWPALRQTLKMRELQKCVGQLNQWGREYRYLPAIEYADTLSRQLAAFDWNLIPKTIENFPRLKETLKTNILNTNSG